MSTTSTSDIIRPDWFPTDTPWLSGRSTAAVMLFGAALLLPFLGSERAISYHEMLFAEPAREMLASGDWLLPRVAGVPSNHKPPLTHWLIAVSMRGFGTHSEWAARVPSVLAALFMAWVIAGLAARWLGDRVGLLAGVIQLSTYYLLRYGRLAESDIWLGATVTGAMAAFALAEVDSPHGRSTARWLPWAFYLAAGLSFLVKGPLGSVFIFAGCASWLALSRQTPRWRFWLDPVGLLLYGLLVVAWPLAAYQAYPPIVDDWMLHNLGRFQGELRGFKHPLYYFYSLPAFMLPWTPFAVQGVVHLRRDPQRYRPLLRLVFCWLLPGVLILSFSAFKRKHYAVPLLPPMSIVAAAGLHYFWFCRPRSSTRGHVALGAGCLVLCGLGLAWVGQQTFNNEQAISLLMVLVTLGLLAVIVLRDRGAARAGLVALAITGWLAFVGIQWQVAPHYDSFRSQRELALRINQAQPRGQPLFLVHMPENQITYYLDAELIRFDKEPPFVEAMHEQARTESYALMPTYIVQRLQEQAHLEILDQCATVEDHTPQRLRLQWVRYLPTKYKTGVKGVD